MTDTPAESLLQVWESGFGLPPGQLAMVLFGLARPDLSPAELAEQTVGERDAALLDLYGDAFGRRIEAVTKCPNCATALEFDLDVPSLRVPPPPARPQRFRLEHDGHLVTFRLPTAGDLAMLDHDDAIGGRVTDLTQWLLRRCVVSVEPVVAGPSVALPAGDDRAAATAQMLDTHGSEVLTQNLAAAVEAAIAETAAEQDPLAETSLALGCRECGANWIAPFDIVAFVWERLDAWAMRLLSEVHALASAYGWTERDILALSTKRRRRYLDLVGT